jgi:hypothetical protein
MRSPLLNGIGKLSVSVPLEFSASAEAPITMTASLKVTLMTMVSPIL